MEVYRVLGESYNQIKDYDDAITTYMQLLLVLDATSTNPNDQVTVYQRLAQIYTDPSGKFKLQPGEAIQESGG